MNTEYIDPVVKEQITENRNWLRTLSQPQLRALACQRGIRKWKTLAPKTLVTKLAQELDIQEPVRV